MKPTPRKGKGNDQPDKDLVNQPKITSFFVRVDPSTPKTSADLRQTKLLNFSNKNNGSPSKRKRISSARKGKGKQNKRPRLVPTKVIPDEEVITLDSSDESNEGASNGNAEQAEPVAGPSGIKVTNHNNSKNTNANIHNAETQKIDVKYDEATDDDDDEIDESHTLGTLGVAFHPDPADQPLPPGLRFFNYSASASDESEYEVVLNSEIQPAATETKTANATNEAEMETQLDEGQEDVQVHVDPNSENDGRSSPSLLTNCNSQLLKYDSGNGDDSTAAESASLSLEVFDTVAIGTPFQEQETCQLNGDDSEDDGVLNNLIDQEISKAFPNHNDETQVVNADEGVNSEQNEAENDSVRGQNTLIINNSNRCSSPSPNSAAQGKIFITPIKKLQEPTTPTKSPLNGHSTPKKMVKSKVLKFSPVRHLKSPSRKGTLNSPFKGGIPTYFSPAKTQPGSNGGAGSNNLPTTSAAAVSSPQKKFSSLPYYLENFAEILNAVSLDDHHSHLFDEEDLTLIKAFNSATIPAQSLFVKLFQRKWTWRPASTIKYPEIAEDLGEHFQALHEGKLLVKLEPQRADQIELRELLGLLSAEQANELAKKMGLKLTSKTKGATIEALLELTTKQKTLIGSSANILHKAACEALGPTYKVTSESKRLFSRTFILYSPPQYWEEESDQGTNQLLSSLLTKVGRMQYPTYKISKNMKIYRERADILRFQDAWTLHSDMHLYTDCKDWSSGQAICDQAVEQFIAILSDNEIKQHDRTLPQFLRAYTAGSVLSRTIHLGIETFQKQKNYSKANEITDLLLEQKLYLTQYRGRWIERLFINSSKHLKKSNEEIVQILDKGLLDEQVHQAHKFGFRQRLEKLAASDASARAKARKSSGTRRKRRRSKRTRKGTSSDSSDDDEEEKDENVDNLQLHVTFDLSSSLFKLQHEIPQRVFEGEKMSWDDNRGGKSSFIGPNSIIGASGNSISSVELFAREEYKKLGYINGLHGEGAVPVAIFCLIFWDIIFYDGIPDVFLSPHQPYPLDIYFEDFYHNRKDLIETMLNNLRHSWYLNDVVEVVEANWQKYTDTTSVAPQRAFESLDQVKCLLKSMGLPLVANLCEKLARDFRYYRSGFPDLTLWSSSECIFVEVKGPGDSLSSKQSLWLDYLLSIGAKAEVCLVKSVSNKRIRPS